MANYRHIMAVVSIGLFGCDTDVSLTTTTTSSALKTDAQLNELEGDLRAPGSMCVADASEQNVEYGATANPLALDVPFSSNICRLLAPAGIASPGQIGTVTSMSAGGNGDLDATCQAAMDASGRAEVEHELCGAKFVTYDTLGGHADVAHCKDCSSPTAPVCGARACAKSELAGTSRSARGYAFRMPIGDLDAGLGADCDAELIVGLEQVNMFEASTRGAGACSSATSCGECAVSRLELTPTMQVSGACTSAFGLGAKSTLSGRLTGLLEAEVRTGEDCAGGSGCVMGRLATHLNVPLKVGVSDRITMGGDVTIAQYRCRGDWEKNTCESATTGDTWSCNWEFINQWPI